MRYGQILSEAWSATNRANKLVWFECIPAFFGIAVFILEIMWQVYAVGSEFGFITFELGLGDIIQFWSTVRSMGLSTILIILIILGALFELLLPSFISGLTLLGVRHHMHETMTRFSLREYALKASGRFFAMFNLKAVLAVFKLSSIAFFWMFLFRMYHDSLYGFLQPLMIIFACFAVLVNLFTFFSQQLVIFENKPTGAALRGSFEMVFTHLGQTITMMLLMMLVHLRILLNVLLSLIIPLVIAWLITRAGGRVGTLGIIGLMTIGLAIATYMTALIEVFQAAVWTKTYEEMNASEALSRVQQTS